MKWENAEASCIVGGQQIFLPSVESRLGMGMGECDRQSIRFLKDFRGQRKDPFLVMVLHGPKREQGITGKDLGKADVTSILGKP